MEKFELHNKIVQQLRFHRISGLDEEECANNILSLVQADWTKGCSCYHGDTTGETWCCNKCGKPTSKYTSPSLLSDEEIKAYYTNQHFHHIDGRNYKIKNNHIEGAKWMRSLCSTRIAEMEMEVKRLRFMIDNGLGSKDIQNDI